MGGSTDLPYILLHLHFREFIHTVTITNPYIGWHMHIVQYSIANANGGQKQWWWLQQHYITLIQESNKVPKNRCLYRDTTVSSVKRHTIRLPVAAHIRFKMMLLAFKAIKRAAHLYLQTHVRPHAPERALPSTTSAGLLVPLSLRADNGRSAQSQLFSVLAHQWWNKLLTSMPGQQSHSPLSENSSRPCITWLPPNPSPKKKHICTCMVFPLDHRTYVLKLSLKSSSYHAWTRAWK